MFLQTSTCLFQRDASGREQTPSRAWAAGPAHTRHLAPFFLPCILHSTLKPTMLAMSICCWVWPWTSAFSLQTQRQSKVCLWDPNSHSCRVHFWGRAPCPGTSANLFRARENRLASASLCFPHLICPASRSTAGEGLNTHVLWEQG